MLRMPRGVRSMTSPSAFSIAGFVHLAGAVGVDIDRQRLGDADGIGELDGAAVGDARRDDVLGQIARGIGRRAIDLGRVLAGEGAAAVRRRAAVGVDDDLAAGQPGVAVGTADDELAGRVDVPDGCRCRSSPRAATLRTYGLDDLAHVIASEIFDEVLVRDDDRASTPTGLPSS